MTNIEEFSLYFQTIMKGSKGESNILKKDSYKEMLTQYTFGKHASGLFWDVGDKLIGHSGGDPGVSTFAYFDPKTGRGRIAFCNTSDTKKLGEEVGRIFKILGSYWEE